VLIQSWTECLLAMLIGVNFSVAVTLMGKGMLLLGALREEKGKKRGILLFRIPKSRMSPFIP
jgi:hypothetical protein